MFSECRIEMNYFTTSTDFTKAHERMKIFLICFAILFVVTLIVNILKLLNESFCFSKKIKFTTPPENMEHNYGEKLTWTFHRANMSEKTFLNLINQWIANEQGIVVLKIETDGYRGATLNNLSRFCLSSVTLSYTYSSSNCYKYGVDILYQSSSIRHISKNTLITKWNNKNPESEVTYISDTHTSYRGGTRNIQLSILYRYPIGNANVQKAQNTEKQSLQQTQDILNQQQQEK